MRRSLLSLTNALDRPAFRTPFRQESSLDRFYDAITETIEIINTGRAKDNLRLSSKFQIRDPRLRAEVDRIIQALVALRSAFDNLIRAGRIRRCNCGSRDCNVFFLEDDAVVEMDNRRRELLRLGRNLNSTLPADSMIFLRQVLFALQRMS